MTGVAGGRLLSWAVAPKPDYRPEAAGDLERHATDVLITCLARNRYVTLPTKWLVAKLGRCLYRCLKRNRQWSEERW